MASFRSLDSARDSCTLGKPKSGSDFCRGSSSANSDAALNASIFATLRFTKEVANGSISAQQASNGHDQVD